MIKKGFLFPAIFAGSLFLGCSDDSSNPVVNENAEDPDIILPIEPNPVDPNFPIGGQQPIETPDNPIVTQPLSSSSRPLSSSSSFLRSSSSVARSSSSNQQFVASSSSHKEWQDNNAPRESFLPAAGFYSNLTINPPSGTHGGEIKCTTDGSVPSQNSQPIYSAMQISQSTVLRCGEFVNGQMVDSTTQTYFINENVQMPVVAITVNQHDMFDRNDGYYSVGNVGFCMEPCYQANYWKDIELPVHVEFFENGSSSQKKAWEIDAGISISGQWSRYNDKKSVAISMRNEYQDGRLKYSLFKTRPEDKKFKAFNLRNNGNRFHFDYIEDPMLTSLLEGSGVDYQRSRQVVVFYNGQYYGIHDMRERLNEHFVETNYGIDSKTVDIVKHKGDSVTASGGTVDAYVQMLDLINASNFSGENNTAYETVKGMMDVGNFADYMAAEIYYHNGDWPDNNVRAWRSPEQPFKFAVFDLDHGFGFQWTVTGFSGSTNMFSWIRQGGQSNCNRKGCFAQIFNKLIENPDFKRTFVNRSSVMLNHYLTAERVSAAVDAMMATLPSSEMSRDEQKFPRKNPMDHSGSSLKSYASSRTESVRQEYRQEFNLDYNEINMTIAANGNGSVLMEGMKLPSKNYKGKFFATKGMMLTAVSDAGSVFAGWSDGSIENPRLVQPAEGANFTAIFK